ncbi:hypothetical protein EW146_g4905 [Bondarzewia mesenterica]|uniref:5'-Nucleotidase C-terminal domain-containing protein n=1 Tax=Bondarzewia mesenterica TaxID=1095465 RepID=A0A4V3XF04_9AGAM|nr:hypothetical protein EW146_g4905 [Bondarzewia mesenterica]
MPKARKRKTPVSFTNDHSSSSSKPLASRTIIRKFHVLLKRQRQLQKEPQNVENVQALAEIDTEIEDLGGLSAYQRMSSIGQGKDRGGGSEKILVAWLREMGWGELKGNGKHRLLEVGALKPDNYQSCSAWLDVTPIDLRSRHPSILEQDFLLIDPEENNGKWDIISLSLVVNFVPDAKDRGRMLILAHSFLRTDGVLFLAPWVLSNIVDTTTSGTPDCLYQFYVLERLGVRIGVIGLVEKEWIGTVPSWPSHFEYRDMAETGINLSKQLRDSTGKYKCDLIIALTHARVPNDIVLAKKLFALTPSAQKNHNIANEHGVDIILGGHDHLYFIGRGVDAWEGYDLSSEVLGAEDDDGDVLIVKSGTDFRDLSEILLELEDTPEGSVRRKVIKRVTGKHHEIKPGMRPCGKLQKILDGILKSVGSSLKNPLCKLSAEIDVRSQYIRVRESAAGDWFADILRHTYDDALCMKGYDGGADGVFICAGMLRGDSVYGPGYLTLGDVLEILPFEDPLVVLELDGQTLWDTLEASLETWPAQEGRFPVIAGFRVSWDSRRPSGQRVLGVWLQDETPETDAASSSGHTTPGIVDGEPIKRERGGRMYKIVTREYMAQGHDGFLPLKGQRAQFVNKLARVNESQDHIDADTHRIIADERSRQAKIKSHQSRAGENWRRAASFALRWSRSKRHYQDHIGVASKEHMSGVDCFDGAQIRALGSVHEEGRQEKAPADDDMITVHPVVDGRLMDKARL